MQPLTQQRITNIEDVYEKKIHTFYDRTILLDWHVKSTKVPFAISTTIEHIKLHKGLP